MEESEVCIKIVVFAVDGKRLLVLLENTALLQGKIAKNASLDETAKGIFSGITTTALRDYYIEQLYTFSQQEDKGIDIVYYLLMPEKPKAIPAKLRWEDVKTLYNRSIDFSTIEYAIQRLQWKIEYTNVVYSLLPEMFTLSELQEVYETILDKKLDKRNFRKKILSLNFLEATTQKRTAGSRPALLYKFQQRTPHIIKVF